MKVLQIQANTVAIDVCFPQSNKIIRNASTESLDLRQLNSNSDDSMATSDHVDTSNDASLKDSDAIFHSSYAEGRQLHKTSQFAKAMDKYKVALQCKHRTIQSEPQTIQEKFCCTLYYIGKLHIEAGADDTMRGIEAMHFCLNVRRACFVHR